MVSSQEPESLPRFRERLQTTAAVSLSAVDPTIGEIEQLITRIESRVKRLAHTGLPALVRSLQREEKLLRGVISETEAAAAGAEAAEDRDGATDEEREDAERRRLRKLEGRVNGSVIFIEQGCRLWSILKRCRHVITVNQTFQSSSKEARRQAVAAAAAVSTSNGAEGDDASGHHQPKGKDRALLHRELKEKGRIEVHVVDRGYEWLDIRPVGLDRLGGQMTDAGWGWGEHEAGDVVDEEEWEGVLLARQVRRTAEAAFRNRCEYQIPRVRVVLPNISRGANEDVDVFLEQLERIHPHVKVTVEDAGGGFLQREPPALEEALDKLVGDKLEGLTPVINLDHTILIDLISDITHSKLEPQPWQDRTTQAQIAQENSQEGGLMARTLYPVLRGRRLVCTQEAAEHFHEVLSTVGTQTERQRGQMLIPYPPSPDAIVDDGRLHEQFSALTIHQPPADVQIPVSILPHLIDFESAVHDGRLPRVALDVARCGGFRSAKLSIYMHGWIEGIATLTSNKEIRGHIRTWVEANRRPGEEAVLGPMIYRFDMTRNLLAKSATPKEEWRQGETKV